MSDQEKNTGRTDERKRRRKSRKTFMKTGPG